MDQNQRKGGQVESAARRLLKALRRWTPLNHAVTSTVRAALGAGATPPEWAVAHLHRMGVVRARLPNGRVLRLWSRGDDWISNQVFWRGWAGHEPETSVLFFALARRAAATLDVGAHVGYYALLAAHANPSGRVTALEPLPAIHARLLQHASLNRLANLECLMAAAGAREETAQFYHVGAGLPTSSSLSREFMAGTERLVSTPVPVVVLDRLVRARGLRRVDLVKVDTESTEPDVLVGLRETLARDRPWILCEVLKGRGAEERLGPLLQPFGYRFYLLTPQGPVPRARIEGHPQWLNYLFAAREEEVPRP